MSTSRSKTQFKQIKKTQNKAEALQQKFQTMKKGNQEEEDSGEEDQVINEQESLHQKLTYQYLGQAKLEEALIAGLRASISGDVVPKNPWCEVSRALGDANLRADIFNNFEKLAKNFKKTPTVQTNQFGIHRIYYSYKQKQKVLNENNEIEEVFEDKLFEAYGYEQMLEYIFLPRLKDFYMKIQNILPSFTQEHPNGTLQVVNSLSGGYLIKSELVIYPKAHPKDLDIFCECFVNAMSVESALEIFAQFVYDDCVAYYNKNDLHLIKDFLIYKFDEKLQTSVKFVWKMKNIRANKNRFIQDIIANAKEKNNMYWKGYCKVQAFEDLDQAEALIDLQGEGRQYESDQNKPESIPYQYIEVYKTYNLHAIIGGNLESFSNQPLGSLIKGVFFNEQQAQKYASFFYKKNEQFTQSQYFQNFVRNHLMLVLKKWEEQNIGASAWELFYLALYIPSIDQRRDLLESIFQIISSDYSALVQCTKLNNILRMLMELYYKNPQLILKPIIFTAYNVFREQMMQVFGKSSGSDIIRYREFIFRLLREMEDNQGGFILSDNSEQVLKTMLKVSKFMGIGNLQRVGAITHSLSQYIYEALKQNKLLAENASYITFEEFQSLKVPKKMMHVSQEVNEFKLIKNSEYKTNADIEDNIILTFLNEYYIFDNLYFILRDLFFGKQLPNPLPTAQFKVETKAIKYQLFEITRKEVDAQMCNELHEGLRKDIKDPTKEFYEYISEDMFDLDLKPIYGLKQYMYYAAVFEMSGLMSYLQNFPWQKALKRPLPSSYQVQPIFSVSGTYLFHDADVINRTYGEWTINWDWIIKGASYAHAQQIFIDTILKYVSWLEIATDLMVMGFYTKHNPREPFLEIEEIIKAEDLTEIKQRLITKFTEQSQVYFKFMLKIETRFKQINYMINLHFIDPTSPQTQNLMASNQLENYVKVFFSKSEFLLWNKLYPYSDNMALNLIKEAQKKLFYLGSLNDAMKLELIKFYLTQSLEIFLTQCRILFSYSESFYNYAREAESLSFLYTYLSKLDQKEKKKMESALDLQDYFNEFVKALQEDLLAYDNIYFDSIGATILNYIEGAKDGFEGGSNYSGYASKMAKLSDMCTIISDSVVLTFRQLLLEDYGYTILWVPKQK